MSQTKYFLAAIVVVGAALVRFGAPVTPVLAGLGVAAFVFSLKQLRTRNAPSRKTTPS